MHALALALLATAPAAAGDWPSTLPPAAVGSHLHGKAGYIVLAAGPASAGRDEAAQAIESALRASGKATLVMNGKSAGAVAELDDPAIVKRCSGFPVDYVAVVRVFEEAGQVPQAVVTIYDKKAKVAAAFTAQKGTRLAAAEEDAAGGVVGGVTGKGVSDAAILGVGGLGTYNDPAKEAYDKEYVWFGDWVGVNQYGAVVSSWTNVYQGKYKKPLEGADFYAAVDRPDLAAKYHENEGRRSAYHWTGGIVGTAMMAVPVAYYYANKQDCGSYGSAGYSDCSKGQNNNLLIFILGESLAAPLVGLGVGALICSLAPDLQPVGAPEARQLADEHNKRLKKKLGLASAGELRLDGGEFSAAPDHPELSLSFGAAPIQGGGMVMLGVRF
jgi:hypothetical protein